MLRHLLSRVACLCIAFLTIQQKKVHNTFLILYSLWLPFIKPEQKISLMVWTFFYLSVNGIGKFATRVLTRSSFNTWRKRPRAYMGNFIYSYRHAYISPHSTNTRTNDTSNHQRSSLLSFKITQQQQKDQPKSDRLLFEIERNCDQQKQFAKSSENIHMSV